VGFRSIHELAGTVMREVESKRAAAANSAAGIEGGAPLGEGDKRSALPGLEAPSKLRKSPRREAPAVQNRGWVKAREGDDARSVNAPAPVLVVDNTGMGSVIRRPKGFPDPALPIPVLRVVRGHSNLANSP
jgi:hypothetical protein